MGNRSVNRHAGGQQGSAGFLGILGVAAVVGIAALTPQALSLTSTRLSASNLPTPSTVLPRFAPAFMGSHWSMTQAQAVTVAQNFDVVAAQANIFKGYAAAMKLANPNVRLVAYINGTFDNSATGTKYPSSWYERDASGHQIRSSGFGNYLMDPANPAWGRNVASECSAAMASSGYDGCFLDTMGTGPLGAGYCTGLPINPATGAVWTAPAWIAATSSVASAVVAANPGAVVILNGLSSGGKYFSTTASTAALLNPTHAAMAEVWLRTAGGSITSYPSASKWLQDVNMLVDAEHAGQSILTTTKLFTSSTQAQQDQWHKFSLASFLLAADGHSYYAFLAAHTDAAILATSTWDHVAIGTPLGAFTQSGLLFERSFSNGIVAVNPNSTPATITFTSQYINLAGAQVTSETLAPNTGDVFLNG